MIVVDASAVYQALIERDGRVSERLGSAEWLLAPQVLDLEVASTLRRLLRGGVLETDTATGLLDDFADMDILRYSHQSFLDRIWELRDNMTPYDAAYIALAEIQDIPLVTTDRKLAGAPGVHARVEVLPIGS